VLAQRLLYQDALKPVAELGCDRGVVSKFIYTIRINVPDLMSSKKADGATWKLYR